MELRVERDALADAVVWTARSLPARPPMQVLLGLLLEVTDDGLEVSGFDYEVSSRVRLDTMAAGSARRKRPARKPPATPPRKPLSSGAKKSTSAGTTM